MKTINRIGIMTFCFIVVAMMVSAISLPTPISGKISGGEVAGLEVEVTNLATGTVMNTKTTYAGEWLVDWANSGDDGLRIGTQIKVVVKECGIAECSKIATYNGEDSFHIEQTLPKVPCPVIEQEVDWVKIGAGGVIGLLIGLIAFMGGGLKIYKNRAGGVTMQHKHKGIRGYHDCNTRHMNAQYRHRRWKDDPMGCIKDVKKIEETGGLI